MILSWLRHRDRDRETQTDRGRDTDRQTDRPRQTDRQTESDRQNDRQTCCKWVGPYSIVVNPYYIACMCSSFTSLHQAYLLFSMCQLCSSLHFMTKKLKISCPYNTFC